MAQLKTVFGTKYGGPVSTQTPKPTPKASAPIITRAKVSTTSTNRISGGSSSRSEEKTAVTPSIAQTSSDKYPTSSVAPSSNRGGFQAVRDLGQLIWDKTFNRNTPGYTWSTPDTIGDRIQSAIMSPQFLLAAPAAATAAIFAAPSVVAATARVAATPSIAATGASTSTVSSWVVPAAAAAGGIALGGVLFGGSSNRTAPQTQNIQPAQSTSQAPNVPISQPLDVSPKADIGGGDWAGRDIRKNLFQDTYTYNYPTASPEFIQTPTQNVSPSQSQEASSDGTNWGMIALIGLGAYVLMTR